MDEVEDFFGNDDFDREPSPYGEEAIEVNEGTSDDKKLHDIFKNEKKKQKRVVNPRLTLNEQMLVGPRGLPALRNLCKDLKLNPKANPYANLNVLMKKYAHWGHLMFPKMKTEDLLNRCETLGTRRQVKVYMMKTRLGMPLTDEDFEFESKKRSKKSDKDLIIDDGADDEVIDENENQDLFRDSEEKTSAEKCKKEENLIEKEDEIEQFELNDEEIHRENVEALEDEIMADFDLNNDF